MSDLGFKKIILAVTLILLACTPCFAQEKGLNTEDIANRAYKALVQIQTESRNGDPLAQGSGFFFTKNLIATNLHLFRYAIKAHIKRLGTNDLIQVKSIVGWDVKNDLCIIRLDSKIEGVTPLTIDSAVTAAVGEDIVVAGNPLGLEGTISKGIVSALRKDQDLIQIDAAISPGSSGGPVLNKKAEVIGIATSGLTIGNNLNFAVPSAHLKRMKKSYNLSVMHIAALATNSLLIDGLKGRVKSVETKSKSTTSDDRDERLSTRELTIRRYDEQGYVTEHFISQSSKFSRLGKNNKDISLIFKWRYKYNDNYLLNSIDAIDINNHVTTISFSDSDEIGKRLFNFSNIERSGTTTNDTEYDKYGRIMRYPPINGDYQSCHYNENGDLSLTEYHIRGFAFKYEYRYIYDEHGNWIQKICINEDSEEQIEEERKIEYY